MDTHEQIILHTTGRHGKLKLLVERWHERTIITESFFQLPLQVMKPYRDESGCLCIYLLSPTGGVVQRDQYKIEVRLSEKTHLLLTTQAATKVYGMPKDRASQHIEFHIGEDAILEYLPDPIILFRDANFSQQLYLFLKKGAKVAFQEIVMPGRLAHAEKLAFTQYYTHLEASDETGLLLYDAFRLQPRCSSYLTTLGVLEDYSCWGSWYLLGDFELSQSQWDHLCGKTEPLLNQRGESIGGISHLHRNGLSARMIANRAQTIVSAFQTLWNLLKIEIFGLKPVDLRKY